MMECNHPECENSKCPLRLSCNKVPASINYRSPFSDIGSPIDVLFIADHPGSRESVHVAPFLGPERAIIESAFKKHAPEFSYAFTYLVRGWPVEEKWARKPVLTVGALQAYQFQRIKTRSFGKHPDRKTITELCHPFLLDDIKTFQPRLIVVMGNTVKEALFPQEHLTITRLIKTKRSYKGIETRFMTTPQSLLQNPSGKKMWEAQLASIIKGKIPDRDTAIGEDFLITELQDALDYIEILKNTPHPISVDLETLNLNKRYGNKIATIQFAETTDTGVTIPLNHPDTPFNGDEIQILTAALYDLFHNPSKIPFWIGQNLKFECNLLKANIGTSILSAPIWDTMVAAFLLDENRRERASQFEYGIYSLKQLALDYLNFDGYDQGILANRAEGNLFDLPLDKLSSYGAMDVYITYRLYYALLEEAEDQNYTDELNNLMFNHYTGCIRLCSDLEQNGFFVDKKHLRNLVSSKSPLLTEMADIEKAVKESIPGQKANDALLKKGSRGVVPLGQKPWVFNLAKGGHPQTLFFDVLRLEPGKIGKSGLPSVDSAWQKQNLSEEYVQMFSEWQGLRILYNTFATKLYGRIDPRGSDVDCNTDGHIRPDFISTGPVTGRWACRNPNLQNIPRSDSPAKKAVKDIFRAVPGNFLVQLDYKANEVRWVGILAQDNNLASAIHEGKRLFDTYRLNPSKELLFKAKTYGDIHKQTASMIFGKKLEDVTKAERQAAKACLAKGTLTPTKKGFKPIEEIQVGEEVWTGEKWTPVLELYRKKSKIYRITSKRGWYVDVSEDHKMEVYDRLNLSTTYKTIAEIDIENHYIPLRRQDSFDFEDIDINFIPDEGVSEDEKLQCPHCQGEFHNLYSHLIMTHNISTEKARAEGITQFKSDFMLRKFGRTMAEKFKFPEKYPVKMSEDLSWWLGCVIAEGSASDSQLEFSQHNNDYLKEYLKVHFDLFGVETSISRDKRTKVLSARSSSYIKQFALFLGFKHGCGIMEVPWSVLRSSKKCQAAFVRGFMSGDGSSCPNSKVRTVKAMSKSELLIRQLSVILWNFGIVHTVSQGQHKLPVKKIWKTYYSFTITGEGYDRYFETIGESYNIYYQIKSTKHPNDDSLYGLLSFLQQNKKDNTLRYEIHSNSHVLKELSWDQIKIHKEKYQKHLAATGHNKIKKLLDDWSDDTKPFLAKVESVVELTHRGEEEVYDLTLDPAHPYFVAHGARHWDCVFGILYGSSVRAIAEKQHKEMEEVQGWFDQFYERFPKISDWKTRMENTAKTVGYVTTLNGRRRRFPLFDMYRNEYGHFNPDDPRITPDQQKSIQECLRQAVNAPIQGVASDSGMVGASLFADYIRQNDKPWVICNAVHDSCVYQVPYAELEESLKQAEHYFTAGVMSYMSQYFDIDFNLPLEIDFEIGLTWGGLEEWDYSPAHLKLLKEKFISV